LPLESRQAAFDWWGFSKLALQAVCLVGVFFALGLGTVGRWSDHRYSGIAAMTAAAMICFFAAVIGLVPLWKAGDLDAERIMKFWLVGTSLKMLLTVTVSASVLFFELVPMAHKFVFGAWTIGFYLVLLVWETVIAVKQVKKTLQC
jgi:hypothetical protein